MKVQREITLHLNMNSLVWLFFLFFCGFGLKHRVNERRVPFSR